MEPPTDELPPSPRDRLSFSSSSLPRRPARTYSRSPSPSPTSPQRGPPAPSIGTRALALLCVAFLALGSHFAANILSSLKTTLKRELGITNAQFHVLNATYTLVGTTLPILIGIWIDRISTASASLTSTTLITLGELFFALAPYLPADSPISPFCFMVIGRVVVAVGASSVTIVQQSIIARVFGRDRDGVFGVGVALGVQIATARLSGVLALGTAIPLAEAWGFYGVAFWVSFGVCGLSWLVNLLFLATVGRDILERPPEGKKFQARDVLCLPVLFWLTVLATFLFHGILIPFGHTATELISSHSGVPNNPLTPDVGPGQSAGWVASLLFFIPFLLSPISGILVDRFSRRATLMFMGALLILMGIRVVGWGLSPVWDAAGMTLFGMGYTVAPLAMLSSIPLLVVESSTGTALGIYKCYLNLGASIFDPLVGELQDTVGGPLRDSYAPVVTLFSILSIVAAAFSAVIWSVDKSQGGLLELGPTVAWEKRQARAHVEELRKQDTNASDADGEESRLLDDAAHAVEYSQDRHSSSSAGPRIVTRLPDDSHETAEPISQDVVIKWAEEVMVAPSLWVPVLFVTLTVVLLVMSYISVLVIGYRKG
ncbi:hypothetical protein HDU93_000826 [Gonapodya sp. JEL0774]|nr:hypothetical protein HDU93_000826 [Gonapodya sp. JEL0774]